MDSKRCHIGGNPVSNVRSSIFIRLTNLGVNIMSLSQQVQATPSLGMSEILQKLILENNLAGLSGEQKVSYITNMCESLGLNPTTQPIKLLKFQGKEIPYFTKDATEQLRNIHNVSIIGIDSKIINDLYIATSNAQMPNGRTDSSTGVISIKGLSGENLCNAMLKAETKAKRRVTLSICGLGFLDESEVESMKQAEKENVFPHPTKGRIVNHTAYQDRHQKMIDQEKEMVSDKSEYAYANEPSIVFHDLLEDIQESADMDQLKKTFVEVNKINFKSNPDLLKQLIEAKDKRKAELMELSAVFPEIADVFPEKLSDIQDETGKLTE